jgi:hypothetical protein
VLAQTFGVNANTVREIVTHQNWKEEHRPA